MAVAQLPGCTNVRLEQLLEDDEQCHWILCSESLTQIIPQNNLVCLCTFIVCSITDGTGICAAYVRPWILWTQTKCCRQLKPKA
jgi:hypothetical protein